MKDKYDASSLSMRWSAMYMSLRIVKTLAVVTAIFFSLSPLSLAAESETPASSQIVDAGNKFCPVSGDKVSGEHFVDYKGKRYGLCCPACIGKFKQNPAKYLAKVKPVKKPRPPMPPPHDHHHP